METRIKSKLYKSKRETVLARNFTSGCKIILNMSYGDDIKTYIEYIFHECWRLPEHDKRVAYVCGQVDNFSRDFSGITSPTE